MSDFLLIYEGGDPDWAANLTPEERKAVMAQWGAWFEELEESGHLRNPGAALAPESVVVTANGEQATTDRALAEVKELIGGYSVIAADSLDEAREIAKGSPLLANYPDNSRVRIRPVLPMEA